MRTIFKAKGRPEIGETRRVRRFLWLPVFLRGEMRWLERAVIVQVWRETWGGGGEFGPPCKVVGWCNQGWGN